MTDLTSAWLSYLNGKGNFSNVPVWRQEFTMADLEAAFRAGAAVSHEVTDTHRDPSRPSDGQKVIRDMASASVHVPIEDPARDGGGHPAGLQSGVPPQREGETGDVTRNAGAPGVAAEPHAEHAWMIEMAGERSEPLYWHAEPDMRCIGGFDPDASKAMRFCREKDALAMALMLGAKGMIALTDVRRVRITEHAWPDDEALAPSTDGTQGEGK